MVITKYDHEIPMVRCRCYDVDVDLAVPHLAVGSPARSPRLCSFIRDTPMRTYQIAHSWISQRLREPEMYSRPDLRVGRYLILSKKENPSCRKRRVLRRRVFWILRRLWIPRSMAARRLLWLLLRPVVVENGLTGFILCRSAHSGRNPVMLCDFSPGSSVRGRPMCIYPLGYVYGGCKHTPVVSGRPGRPEERTRKWLHPPLSIPTT